MVALRETIFMRLQPAKLSKQKVLIGTVTKDPDAEIALAELQNRMKMGQAVFDKPP